MLSALSASGQDHCPTVSDPASNTPTVLYTAKLLGYVWHERPGVTEPVTSLLWDNIQCARKQYPDSILIGMGDNLAPEYESRFDAKGQRKDRVPQAGAFDFHKDPTVEAFPYLGYDVLVPYHEDFYFGAEYLRSLGVEWNRQQEDKKKSSAPKLMAANLVIGTTPVTPVKYEDKSDLDYISQLKGVSPAIPDAVLPWNVTLGLSLDQDIVKTNQLQAELCRAPNNPVEIESKGCMPLCWRDAGTCKNIIKPPANPPSSGNKPFSYIFEIPDPNALEPSKSYGFCITGLPMPKDNPYAKRFCKPFQVAWPFFWDDKLPVNSKANRPWYEIDKNDVRFVVFAVVEEEFRGALSRENATWLDNKKQRSEVLAVPPDQALSQAVEAYVKYAATSAKPAIHVLLAQMSPANAEAFAASLNANPQVPQSPAANFSFDVVLSAADQRRSTGNEVREIAASKRPGNLSAPLMIPHPIYIPDAKQPLVDPLEAVFITTDAYGQTYVNEPYMPAGADQLDKFHAACVTTPSIYQDLVDVLKKRHPEAASQYDCPGSSMDPLKCFTLDSIRKEFSADLAMLQQWSFFDACVYRPQGQISKDVAPDELIESLRRTLWSTSYVTRISITGAKLKTVLDNSAKIATAQKSSTYTSLLHDRDLAYIGVSKKDKTYYVDGLPIDDARIYSIATDDALAVGNTEYLDVADSSFAAPEIFRGDEAEDTLAYVCQAFTSFPEYHGKVDCPGGIAKKKIMAAAGAWAVPDHRSPLGPRQMLYDYAKSLFPAEPPLPTKGAAAETATQNHRILSLTLQNLAGSFAFSKPNRTDLGVQEVFGGVTNNQVIKAHTEQYSLQDAFRLNWSGAHFNFGFDEEVQFGRSRQGDLTGGPDSVTLTNNLFLVSPFVEFNLHRWTPRWKLVLRPIDYLSDLAGTQFKLDSADPNTQFKVKLLARNNLQTRFGVRFERDTTGTSFFEFGYVHRDARNVLSSVTFNPGTAAQFFCPLNIPQSAGACAAPLTPVNKATLPTFGSFQQNGAYWSSIFTIPILAKPSLSYVFATDGNLFSSRPGQDVSPLTRYAVNIDNSVKFPFWGNLAFSPHYGIFLFEDQVQHATLTRTVADVQLTYYFDWHDGLRWRDVLKGKAAQSAAGTAGLGAAGFSSTPNILK
jgi:hypothetical protein